MIGKIIKLFLLTEYKRILRKIFYMSISKIICSLKDMHFEIFFTSDNM